MEPFDPSAVEHNFPPDLLAQPRWLAWKAQQRGQSVSKKPIAARINDPQSWCPFKDAARQAIAEGDGVGFVLGDGIIGIDFDHVIGPLGQHPAASDAVRRLGSYTEVSPSGTGIHVLIRGSLERSAKLGATSILPAREIYAEGRYFTVTGQALPGFGELAGGPMAQRTLDELVLEMFSSTPKLPTIVDNLASNTGTGVPLSNAEVLTLLNAAKNSPKAMRLYRGDSSGYPSQSEADFAFVRILRFYTRDAAQIDALFRASGLMRTKWDERHGAQTYGAQTIARALAQGGKVYTPRSLDSGELTEVRLRTRYVPRVPLWWVARTQGLGEIALRTLLAIASFADEKGRAWPLIETLAELLNVNRSTVDRVLPKLREAQVLSWVETGGANVYTVSKELLSVGKPLLTVVKPKPDPRRRQRLANLQQQDLATVAKHKRTIGMDTGGTRVHKQKLIARKNQSMTGEQS